MKMIYTLFLFALLSSACCCHAFVNDFCVANVTGPVGPSGYECKPPNTVTVDDKYGEKEIRCIEREREALLRFKAGVVDRYGMLSSWTTPHCCQWQGIRCSNLTGHILMLDLHGEVHQEISFNYYTEFWSKRFISGEIHESLMELSQLQYLNLSSNSFPDSIIPEFLGSLSNLRYLDLSWCDFDGKIPTQLGSLSHLEYLNLAGNVLEGPIPRQLGNLFQLQHLDLSYNIFEGNIPSQLGNLSNLHELYIGGVGALKIGDGGQWLSNLISLTHLYLTSISNLYHSHSLLQLIGKLPKLRELSLSDCSLTDNFFLSLRPSIFNFSTSLTRLDLSENTLMSTMIFQWVANFTPNLVELHLSHNHLEGSVPNHFGLAMNSLEHLNLYSNRFKVEVLQSFMNICTLKSLNMGENSLNQSLSSILHNLSNACARNSLQELDMRYNQIHCSLPDFSMFTTLKILDLSDNQLSGKIPEDILPSRLESLSVRLNFLEGEIPKSFGNTRTLRSLDITGNRLSGEFSIIFQHLSGCAKNVLQYLKLGGNNINGTFPDLSRFSNLKILDLSGNQLTGEIPEGNQLPSQLESLSIRSNTLEGGIPKSFGNACALRLLDMDNNNLSEEFPLIVHHLSGCARHSLESLYLGWNQINGTLPDLSVFSSLKSLSLAANKLNGQFPNDIQFPHQLEGLYMTSNSLKGVLSDYQFANMSKLYSLHLSGNSLLSLKFTQNWVPPFQLRKVGLQSCILGPTFPKWLQTQNEFSYLDISNAGISDMVPKWFWTKLALRKWVSMNISYNSLHGIIPYFPTKNPYDSLILGSNEFEGPISPFLRSSILLDLSKNKFSDLSFLCVGDPIGILYQLDLSNNNLSGQIPDCWSHFKSLAFLDLSQNQLSGKIPTSMGSLHDLQALFLRNNLTYGIPFSLRHCTNLVMIDIAENSLSGSIPRWIGSKLGNLQYLSLRRNHFQGNLPLQICFLRNIQLLDLSLNKLSGQILKCIKNFTSMTQKTYPEGGPSHWYRVQTTHFIGSNIYGLNTFLTWKGSHQMFENNVLQLLKSIDLSGNYFSEEIPKEFEILIALVSLNLSRNNLSGEIPSNIGKLTSLEFLDISRNELVGSIPNSLIEIDRLSMLDLSHNHLVDIIPQSTQLQSFNASSYEDNLNLCGPPLDKCKIAIEEPKNEIQEDDYSFFNREFYIGMSFGFIISFWMIVGLMLFRRSTP
ncbi:receptor-like protein 12 [Vigna radiata var. radiata]|uniref:Receptor-like protein 12 n=1 Tax=Vigna radiata var. radiata TaxID=3916 RepID=A0A1S3U4R6_VIGRR|nr:receptor-like protein 12 [Vigna radiata var. radiata]